MEMANGNVFRNQKLNKFEFWYMACSDLCDRKTSQCA